MRSVKDILLSAHFKREISVLLFVFAAFSFLVSLLLFSGGSDYDTLTMAVGGLVQAVIYAVLGIFIRRGSNIALVIAGMLFVVDTALVFVLPTDSASKSTLLGRALLIVVLISYIRKRRKMA